MESSRYEVKNLWAMADMVTRDRRARWVPTIYNQRFDYGRRSQGIDHREYGPRQREDHRCHGNGAAGCRKWDEGADAAVPQRVVALRRTRCSAGLRRQVRDEADGTRLREGWRRGNRSRRRADGGRGVGRSGYRDPFDDL